MHGMPLSHMPSSQPFGGSCSPKHTSHISGSHGLPHISICGSHIVQFSSMSSEQLSAPPMKMLMQPSSVHTSQQPKQSQPGGTNCSQNVMQSGSWLGGMFSQL